MFYDNKIIDAVCGKKDEFSVEHRSINAIIAVGMIMVGIGSINNLIFSLKDPLIHSITGLLCFSILYYIGRIRENYWIAVYGTFFYMLSFLSLNWFINGGTFGPTVYFYFSVLVEFILITPKLKRVLVVSAIFINVVILFIFEHKFPAYIVPYNSDIQRNYDLYSSFIMNVLLLYFIVVYIYSSYRTAKEEAEKTIQEKEALIDNIVNMAYYNINTNLPNRKMYEKYDIRKKYEENLENTYIGVINIENYDAIVNNFSYDTGIGYIESFGIKLKANFENIGEVFHFETHKFVIVFSAKDINIVKYKMENMKNIILLKNIILYSELSIGLVKYESKYSNMNLMKRADTARTHSKKKLSDFLIFNEEMENYDIEKMQILGELKEAIKKGELELYFQPKVDMINSNNLTGVEALIRWNHPVKGIIPPIKFIPYLEETTLINEVTKWVYETSLKKIVSWQEKGVNTKIAINISVTNLCDKEFHFYVEEMLKLYKVNPENIEFEITEGKSIEHFESIILVLKKLKEIGIKLSIDDFGTGYSSLAYIKRLPIDYIKIDRMFIKNINEDKNNQKIVSAAISIAETFGLKVVAEGIECNKEWDTLKVMSCDIGQGYLFAKPMSEKDFMSWYENNKIS